MLITSALTIGQLTFILRVTIQILSYGGVFLVGYIILASAPRLASLKTHDTLNRLTGKSTLTKTAAFWIFNSFRKKSGDPVVPIKLVVALLLFMLQSIFTSMSDLGFLGFYACQVPGASSQDFPASINSTEQALAAVQGAMVNGTDLSTIKAYHCDSVSVVQYGPNVTERVCDNWHNSTYADSSFFTGFNTTDSDVLMPRQIRYYDQPSSQRISLNSYYLGPGSSRVEAAVIMNGIAVEPHEMGFRAVFGVPQLQPEHEAILSEAMALEVEMGCMSLGLYTSHDLDASGSGLDLMATNTSWRKYVGPDYMYQALYDTVDVVRAFYMDQFNASSIDSDGFMYGYNESSAVLSTAANIHNIAIDGPLSSNGSYSAGYDILSNCTDALRTKLNLEVLDKLDAANMCSVLGIGGSLTSDGMLYEGVSQMLCATASQVNLVNATVTTAVSGNVSFTSFTRLPAELTYTRADFFDVQEESDGNTYYTNFMPYERFTLTSSSSPSSPTSHFITQYQDYSIIRSVGPGSGGASFGRAGTIMLDPDGTLSSTTSFVGLTILDAGTNGIQFNASMITQWGGQIGASYLLTSTAYNGYAAFDSASSSSSSSSSKGPIRVISTGGKTAICYTAPYAIGFLPLILASVVIIVWAVYLLATSSLGGTKQLQNLYGGMSPYWGVVCPMGSAQDTLLVWESGPPAGPHLEVVNGAGCAPGGAPRDLNVVVAESRQTAVEYLRYVTKGSSGEVWAPAK